MQSLNRKEADYIRGSLPRGHDCTSCSRVLATVNALEGSSGSSSKYTRAISGEWKKLGKLLFEFNKTSKIERMRKVAWKFNVNIDT